MTTDIRIKAAKAWIDRQQADKREAMQRETEERQRDLEALGRGLERLGVEDVATPVEWVREPYMQREVPVAEVDGLEFALLHLARGYDYRAGVFLVAYCTQCGDRFYTSHSQVVDHQVNQRGEPDWVEIGRLIEQRDEAVSEHLCAAESEDFVEASAAPVPEQRFRQVLKGSIDDQLLSALAAFVINHSPEVEVS
jgi:hypothetical protein